MPDVFGVQAFDSVDTGDAILVAVGTGELNDSELHSLMGEALGPLFLVIIVHDQRRMNDAGNPTEQSQKNAKKKTGHPSGQQDGKRRQNDAEKISQRFHFFCPAAEL